MDLEWIWGGFSVDFCTSDGLLVGEGFSNLRKRLEITHPRWSVWSRCLQVGVHFGGVDFGESGVD